MFKTDNKKIGSYLTELIKNTYKSDRQFGIKYLELRDGEVNENDIQNIQNRISQIKNGNKGIQIEDLPIFSELLGVSIENILSAGTTLVPETKRKTNYWIAFSNNPKEWEEYLQREDKPFLNPDEFNKTVIDYALEARNYPLLKYLVDNSYIWFVGENKNEYYLGFGAGTIIKRRDFGCVDILDVHLKERDDLRLKMICLAIENKDFKMLEVLHAREIPLLYTVHENQILSWTKGHRTLQDRNYINPESDSVQQMIASIADSDNTVIDYFFDEFDIDPCGGTRKNRFVFPYAGQVLDALIVKRRNDRSKRFLEKAIEHNKVVQKRLQELIRESEEKNKVIYNDCFSEDARFKEVWREYYFDESGGFLSYHMPYCFQNTTGFITNVIKVSNASNDAEVQFRVKELKKTFNYFVRKFKEKEE